MTRFFIATFAFFLSTFALAMDDYELQTAAAKQRHIQENMQSTAHFQMPEITGPGFFGTLDILSTRFLAKAFTNNGDVMEPDREKRIHSFGTEIQVSFELNRHAQQQFSGLFSSGANYGFLRLSLAEPPAEGVYKPGIVIKFLRTNRPSANIFAMPSLDGVEGNNLFQSDFVTSLPTPTPSIKGEIAKARFQKAVTHRLNMPKGDILALSFDDMARYDENGEEHIVNAPYSLIFRPTLEAKKLIDPSLDFRVALSGKGKDVKLFDVYAIANKGANTAFHIGDIRGTSAFMASAYGDQRFYCKHPMPQEI